MALLEQNRLRERHLQALRRLTELLARKGAGECAMARLATLVEPLREEAHLRLIQLLAAAGQPASALQQDREHKRILDQDLGEESSCDPNRQSETSGPEGSGRTCGGRGAFTKRESHDTSARPAGCDSGVGMFDSNYSAPDR